MSSNSDNDFDLIAQNCNLFNSGDTDSIIKNIEELNVHYDVPTLVKIYNYFLSKPISPDVMQFLIQKIDKYKDYSDISVIADILLLKNIKTDNEDLNEKYTTVRILCAKLIGNSKNTDYISTLLYCLNNKNENYRIRLACADALGKIGDRYAVAPLIDVVKDEEEKSVYVRESAVLALGLLGDSRAVDPLVNILEANQGLIGKFSFLKEKIIETLNKFGLSNNEKVFNALKKSLIDESAQVRIDAIEGIMDSNNPCAFEIIKKCLDSDPDDEVKKNALIALYNISDRKILDDVINSEKYSEKLKKVALEILEEEEND